MKHIYETLNHIVQAGLYPEARRVSRGSTEPLIYINGKAYVNFCSNNYLGLATHPEVIEAAIAAARRFGIGPGTSRYLSGNIEILEDLEDRVAELVGAESAMTTPTGYIANTGVISALMDPNIFTSGYERGSGFVLSDESNHASVIDGCRQSYTKVLVFSHNNLADLEIKLSSLPTEEPKLIVTEGVFSLEAELTPLPGIVELAKKYEAKVLIDDAHSIGILGSNGGGTVQHFGLEGQVDVIMGSFSKALGGMGGFLAGNRDLIDYLRVTTRPFLYSSPISAPVAGGLVRAVELCMKGSALREKLLGNYEYLRAKVETLGCEILGDGHSPVIPLMLHDDQRALAMSRALFEKGILLECFRTPAVAMNTARLRIVPMAHHEREQLDRLVEVLKELV